MKVPNERPNNKGMAVKEGFSNIEAVTTVNVAEKAFGN